MSRDVDIILQVEKIGFRIAEFSGYNWSDCDFETGEVMTETAPLYPPAPAEVSPEVTRLDNAYRSRVTAMVAGLFGFLLIYLLIIAASGVLAYWLVVLQMPNASDRASSIVLVFKYGGALAAGLLCLFLIKGLFKGRTVDRSAHVALREADHPELFAFIRRVYTDVGAPPPRRIYVSPDVNAALIYDISLLNLALPLKKDLLIGMGLLNVVNLTEFKAVLAHEFGHFSQRSVGLSRYLYVANQVVNDVIYARDGLDRFVDGWARIDMRISFPAWGLKGVLWAVRGLLSRIYRGLNLLHLSLSRQMEFNADNVAVSVTGSDAIVQGLYRLEFASECLADAARVLDAAADHGLFTDDVFYHQSRSAARLRVARKNDRLGVPPEEGTVFAPADDGIPDKFRSHPTHQMREQNAKRIHISGPRDDRSPWLLVGNSADLKREITGLFYRHSLDRREPYAPKSAEVVQQFLDAEHAETTYDPKYHGWYDNRYLNPGEVDDAFLKWTKEKLTPWLDQWPPADLGNRCQKFRERQIEFNELHGLKTGQLKMKGKSFPFRGEQCTFHDVSRLIAILEKELKTDAESFNQMDRDVLMAHQSAAKDLDQDGGQRTAELLARYRFHLVQQGLLKGMIGEQNRLQAILGFLAEHHQMPADDFNRVRSALREIQKALIDNLNDAKKFSTPALANVPAGSSLHEFIVDRTDIRLDELEGNSISGASIGKLLTRLNGVVGRIRRIDAKSLGGLLAYQEKLAKEWSERMVKSTDGELEGAVERAEE